MLSLTCGILNRLVKQQWNSGCQWLRVWGKQGHEVQSFSYARWISSGDLMYNSMTVVNNAELYTWNLMKAKILGVCIMKKEITVWGNWYAAAKSLQSCPTLCDPIDSSPPGSPVPGILQARTLEWGAISFSNAWKWKVKVKSFSRIRLFVTPWTAAYQAPLSMGFSRQEYWSLVPSPSPDILTATSQKTLNQNFPLILSRFLPHRKCDA